MQVPLVEPSTEPSPALEPTEEQKGWWHKRRWLVLIAALVLCILATSLWLSGHKKTPTSGNVVSSSPTDTHGTLRLKGTTQAVRTRAIQAPLLAGDKEGTLTITNLRLAGSTVKQGDILVEFDRQAQLRDSLDKQAQTSKLADDVLQEEAKEDAARAKDETEIRVAEGDLAKAELEMQKVELLSRIDAEKARETLDEAKATLDQLKETFALKRKTAAASIRILEIQRDRARETMLHAQANAALMQVHSPISGIVVLNTIWKQGNIGEVEEGDQVRPGVPFMQVVDPSEMEVQVPVNQQDLLALHDGQNARVHLDAYPDLVCPAQLEVIDPMGRTGDFSQKVRTFSATWSIKCTDPRLLPGLSAAVDTVPGRRYQHGRDGTMTYQDVLKPRKAMIVAAILLVSSAAIFGLVHLSNRSSTIPAFEVKREEFVDSVQFRGEVKAMKSLTVSAPAEAGELQILKIATSGVDVKKGELIVEFDKSKTEQDLAKDGSALKSAQAAIDQVRAQSRLTEEEDMTAVTKAQYDVEVAKLDASKQEIVSKIEGAEANLKVANAQQKLNEVEAKLKSDRAVIHANVDSKLDASKKAAYDLERAQRSLATMTLVAPAGGLVNLVSVWHVGNMAPFKPGERVWAGAPIAELPDVSTLRVSARVDEAERGRLAAHQSATVQLDAIPERQFSGKLEQIGTIATMDFSAGWPIPRDFDLRIALDQKDPRLKPGMTAQITVIVDRIPNAIAIPVQASFQKSGQTVAYVVDGSKYREQAIVVGRRSRDRILVSSGLRPGDRVALQDPLAKDAAVKE